MREANQGRERILIVDDEPEMRAVLSEFLSEQYDCAAVASAAEALALMRAEQFALIISDVLMARMSGLEMVPHALQLAPDSVIIMISGQNSVETAIAALRVGAFDYITKPFDLEHVEVAVRRGVEHHELRRAKRRYERHLRELVEQRTEELNNALASLEEAYRATLKALTTALETRDCETHGHSERVVNFSLRLGREFALSKEQLRALEFGALLHDIGKIGIPDAILRKPAKLTEPEWENMRRHPLLGQQILRGIEFLDGAAEVVAQHHERWDGTGYPLGLRGAEIDLKARIFAVADAFDAIVSDRIYRNGKPYEAATAELIRNAGTQFDPEVVAAFCRIPPAEWEYLRRPALPDKRDGARTKLLAGARLFVFPPQLASGF